MKESFIQKTEKKVSELSPKRENPTTKENEILYHRHLFEIFIFEGKNNKFFEWLIKFEF